MVFDKLVGFSGFGFPKSHAAAFALLAYQSAWLRRYYPAEFLCALLNAQPMGFYPPASLVRDGERRGVRVLPPDVNASEAQCSIEDGAVRVGLGYVSGVGEKEADAVAAGQAVRRSPRPGAARARRSSWPTGGLEALVASGACDCFGEPRRALLWELGLVPRPQSVPGTRGEAKQLALPLEPTAEMPDASRAHAVGAHARRLPDDEPLRRPAPARAAASAAAGRGDHDRRARRQARRRADRDRGPGGRTPASVDRERASSSCCSRTRSGSSTSSSSRTVYERFRPLVRGEPLLLARGRLERVGRNLNVVVARLESLGPLAREAAGLMPRCAPICRARTTSVTAESPFLSHFLRPAGLAVGSDRALAAAFAAASVGVSPAAGA